MIQRAVAILEKEIGGASMMQIKTAEIAPLLRITQDRLKTFQESSLRGSRLDEGHCHPQEEGNSISVGEKESKEVVDMIQRAVAIPEERRSIDGASRCEHKKWGKTLLCMFVVRCVQLKANPCFIEC